jgi:hypothetical protein
MSERLSGGPPSNRSGAMYARVPMVAPLCVNAVTSPSIARAMPKSTR